VREPGREAAKAGCSDEIELALADGAVESDGFDMIGTCEHCGQQFNFELFHCGFAEWPYAYCGQCGMVAILSCWSEQWPEDVKGCQKEIAREMEPHLKPCACGGKFTKGNNPRCPHCKHALSAELAAVYIEEQAPGAKKGWRWQRNWSNVYCVVVEKRIMKDVFC
jgi:hypothetical protein